MGRAEADAQSVQVDVAYSPAAGQTLCLTLQLPPGATLDDALQASGLRCSGLPAGIWGRIQPLNTVLRDFDRVEIYRPLQVDPKEARRLRYKARGGQRHV